jgi:hypothetical protein
MKFYSIRDLIISAALAMVIAICGSFAPLAANAAPLGAMKSAITQSDAQDSDVTLVRDGCGRGMRFSNRRQACVEDFGGGPQVAPGCPRGTRFSNSRQACVPMDGGVDPGVAVIQGIIGGVLSGGGGGGRGDGCPRGMRFSNSRQACVPR